ncbi:uncharacterized protein ACMZJ9_016909 [Mantella aurantiaca]
MTSPIPGCHSGSRGGIARHKQQRPGRIKMASQKKPRSQRSLSPSPFKMSEASQRHQQQQKLDEDELKEEDLEYLHRLENSFFSAKDKTGKHKRKESKKHKKSALASGEPFVSPKLASPSSDSSFKNGSSKKRRSRLENFLPSEDSQSGKMYKIADPSSTKVKKGHHEGHYDPSESPILYGDIGNGNHLADSAIKRGLPKNRRSRLENFLSPEDSPSGKISDPSAIKVKKGDHEGHYEPLKSQTLCGDIENVNHMSDSAIKSGLPKNRRYQLENFLPSEDSQSGKIPDPSSIKVKRSKKGDHEAHYEPSEPPILRGDPENANRMTDSAIKNGSSKNKGKRSALENLPENEQSGKITDSPSVKVKKEKKKKRDVRFESLLPNYHSPQDNPPPPERRSSRKKLKRQPRAESLSLFSPLALPKAFLEDKAEASWSRADNGNDLSDHSQDLFITQKPFLPIGHLSWSGDSPPLGQERQDPGTVEQKKSPNSSCGIEPLSRSFPKSEDERQDSGGTSKATQTDNLFTYLSLMTFLKKVTAPEACTEKPLDLRSPARAARDQEVIVIGSSPDLTASGKGIKRQIVVSPPQPFDQSRFVQSILNSSYYFKGKGENGVCTPITPLLRQKEKPKKQGKKPIRS